ncbi:MAG: hypothetical protein Q9209_004932 [Squamulea sp. 1 TL-2023]
MIMVDRSAEDWRWYINFLEDKFQEITEGAISTDADIPLSPKEAEDVFSLGPRTNTQNTNQTRKSRVFSFLSAIQKANTMPTVSEVIPLQQFRTNPRSGKKQPLPPGMKPSPPGISQPQVVQRDIYGQPIFGFGHLQDIQGFEESANETVLVLELNMSICRQLEEFYHSLFENRELPPEILDGCQKSMLRFERKIKGVMSHMDSQILRVKALLRLIADRKTLVSKWPPFSGAPYDIENVPVNTNVGQLYGLLEFQNTRSNKLLASESHKSNKNMEKVTHEMSRIARKTKTETVSMKIITLVTLFFLPGTFIATLMSTDIIHWNNGKKNYQPGAMHVYLAVCLPFMAATFIFWAAFQCHERRKERHQNEKAEAEASLP